MSNNDIESCIAKPIKLLLSSDDDSCEQLRALLEESIRVKYGPRKAQAIANLAERIKPMKRKIDSISPENSLGKKIKTEEDKSTSNSPTPSYESDSCESDSEDLALEILEDNLCVVCRGLGSSPKNRMLECLDCHNLCHQNCASPPVDADVNDPRFVWYCHGCNKGSNRAAPDSSRSSSASSTNSSVAKTISKSTNTAVTKTFGGGSQAGTSSSSSSSSSSPSSVPLKSSPSNSNNGSGGSKTKTSSNVLIGTSSGNSSSSKNQTSSKLNAISADKRLQIMKKKAAKKQEKRKNLVNK